MVKEGNVLGHKISKRGIEVYREKIELFEKLPYPISVNVIQSFLGHAGFYSYLSRISQRLPILFASVLRRR